MENTTQEQGNPTDSPRRERREKKEKKDKGERKEKKSKRDSSSSSGKEKKHKKDKKSKSSENGATTDSKSTIQITEQKSQDDNDASQKSSPDPSATPNTPPTTQITPSQSQEAESKKDDTKSTSDSSSVPSITVSNGAETSAPKTDDNKNGSESPAVKLERSSSGSESSKIARSESRNIDDEDEEEEEEEEPVDSKAANAHGLVVFHTMRPNSIMKQWESKRASLQPEMLLANRGKTDSVQNLEKNANVTTTRSKWEGNMGQHRGTISVTDATKMNDWQELEGAILSANLASIRNKWKEIEKGKSDTLREPKPDAPAQPVGKIDPNKYLQSINNNDKKEDTPTSPAPAAPRGNVMQFLREKRAEVQVEQASAEKSKYENLPAPPPTPSPVSGYSPTLSSSAPSIAATSSKDKDLARTKSSADIKRDSKSDKKSKADKKDKSDKKEKSRSETVKIGATSKRSTIDVVFSPPIAKSKTMPVLPTVLFDYVATDNRMLSIQKDQNVKILDKTISPHWILVEHDSKTGLFPANFLFIPDASTSTIGTSGRAASGPQKVTASASSGPKGLFDLEEDDEEGKPKTTDKLQGGEIKVKLLAAADEEDILKNNDPLSLQMEEDDSEHNIMYKDGNKEIRGASLTKMMQKLTHEKASDTELLQCFLNTFTAFTTHLELLNLLVLRYRTPKPKNLDMPTFQKTKLLPIRLRVINFLKFWIKKDYLQFKEGPLADAARDFATKIISLSMPNPAKEIVNLLDEAKQGTLGKGRIVSGKPPAPHIPMNLKSDLTLMDIHPEEVARQMTLMEHEMFKKIKSHECIKQKWVKEAQKENAQNIINMIRRFNRVSLWVATEIVSIEDLKLRAVMLNRFIFIAQKCLELNNFNAVMEILSALNNSAVHRLRRTWELLPAKSLEAMEDMTKLMDGEGNFAGYRETLKQSQPPILPYLGLVLTDLVFLDDGNPDLVPDTKLLNVAKWTLISGVVHREILTRAEITYTLEPLAFIQDFLEKRPVIENQHELYELSLKREARSKKSRRPVSTKSDK
mmetsp:Transcript_28104/g.39669  ORF Transcript_28104/g.39669 Transcript_28104/m.39669 type:complete len:1034 (+) Transcript_28104:92-3193(+)